MEVRRLNLYQEGNMHHCNMRMDNCTVERCFEECMIQSRLSMSNARGAHPGKSPGYILGQIFAPIGTPSKCKR